MQPDRPTSLPRHAQAQAQALRRRRFPDTWLFGMAWMAAMLLMVAGAVRASDTPVRAALKKAVPAPLQAALRAPAR